MTEKQIIQRVYDLVGEQNKLDLKLSKELEIDWDPIQIDNRFSNMLVLESLKHQTFGLPCKLLRFIANHNITIVFSSRLDYVNGTFEIEQCYPIVQLCF